MAKSRSRARGGQDEAKTPPPSPTPLAPTDDDDDGERTGGEEKAAPWDRSQGVKAGVPAVSEIPWTDPELTLASSATENEDDGFRTPAAESRPPGYAGAHGSAQAEQETRRRAWWQRLAGGFGSFFRAWFRFRWLGYAMLLGVLFPALALLQMLASPYLLGEEAPYHIKQAWLYQTNGPAQAFATEFAATQASVLTEGYADTHLLFHVLAAPFTYGWEPPMPRRAAVTQTHGAVARVHEGVTVAEGAKWRILVAHGAEAQQLGTFTVHGPLTERHVASLERTATLLPQPGKRDDEDGTGALVSGRVSRGAEAPLRSGLVLAGADGERVGTLLSLESGYLRFEETDEPAEPGALLTLHSQRAGTPLGRLTFGSPHTRDDNGGDESGAPYPFLVHHLHAHAPSFAASGPGGLAATDHRGYVDPQLRDEHEWHRYLASLENSGATRNGSLAARQHPLPLLAGPDSLEARGKLAAAFFLALLLVTLVYVLRENGVRFSLLFAALLCLGGALFAPRLFALDPYLFGMTLLLLAFHFALNGHRIRLIALGVVASLSVGAPWLVALFVVVLLIWLVQWLTREHLWHEFALPAWAALLLGVGLGVYLLHPQSSDLPAVLNAQLAPWAATLGLGGSTATALGDAVGLGLLQHAHGVAGAPGVAEWQAPTTQRILSELWMLWLPVLLAVFGYLARGIRPSAAALMAFTLTALGGVAVLVTLEALAFVVPFVVLFLAFAALDHWRSLGWDVNRRGVPGLPAPTPDDLRSPAVRFLAYRPVRAVVLMGPLMLGGAALVGLGAQQGMRSLEVTAQASPATDVALWMRAHLDTDAQVFTTGWHEFPALFYARPEGRYLVSHSPGYLYFYAPQGREPGEVYDLWRQLRDGEAVVHDEARERDYAWHEALRDIFLTEYALVDKRRAERFNERLRNAPHRAQPVYEDPRFALYRLLDSPPRRESENDTGNGDARIGARSDAAQ